MFVADFTSKNTKRTPLKVEKDTQVEAPGLKIVYLVFQEPLVVFLGFEIATWPVNPQTCLRWFSGHSLPLEDLLAYPNGTCSASEDQRPSKSTFSKWCADKMTGRQGFGGRLELGGMVENIYTVYSVSSSSTHFNGSPSDSVLCLPPSLSRELEVFGLISAKLGFGHPSCSHVRCDRRTVLSTPPTGGRHRRGRPTERAGAKRVMRHTAAVATAQRPGREECLWRAEGAPLPAATQLPGHLDVIQEASRLEQTLGVPDSTWLVMLKP